MDLESIANEWHGRLGVAVFVLFHLVMQYLSVDASLTDRLLVFAMLSIPIGFVGWLMGGFLAGLWGFVCTVTRDPR